VVQVTLLSQKVSVEAKRGGYGSSSSTRPHMLTFPSTIGTFPAKRQLFGEIGIDQPAGPTEVLIVADEHASPFMIAVDILSQCEHGGDDPNQLITTSESVARETMEHIEKLLPDMPTGDLAGKSWRDHGEVIVVDDLDEAYRVADSYGSEHVQILTENPRGALEKMQHYGALFLGAGTCVSYGDKVIGTNHVLPTRQASRFSGGLCVQKFLRITTYQEVTDAKESGELGRLCGRAARAENFDGHARSGDLRAALTLGDEHAWIYKH